MTDLGETLNPPPSEVECNYKLHHQPAPISWFPLSYYRATGSGDRWQKQRANVVAQVERDVPRNCQDQSFNWLGCVFGKRQLDFISADATPPQ